jgi:alkylated DNA repair dioxygenase AlkB
MADHAASFGSFSHSAPCPFSADEPPAIGWRPAVGDSLHMVEHVLPGGHWFYSGTLPTALLFDERQFDDAWNMQPEVQDKIMMRGRLVKIPRKQQAYERDYRFAGRENEALPAPPLIKPLLIWAQAHLDGRLNGLLLNWYDAAHRHYIGAHRDKTFDIVPGSPIVTISFGQERIFRLRPYNARDCTDFAARNGTVFVMPFETNATWTHEVPHFSRYRGRRISVTIRAFNTKRN